MSDSMNGMNGVGGMAGMSGMPGAGAMNDTLEFVRNFWGAMKIPGMSMPSMSPDEINKQIADLKAVESWLQMNMNMLRSTIQTLEVQSATLTALQSMSESFAKATNPSGSAAGGKPAKDKPTQGKPAFQSPFESAFQSPFPKPDAAAQSADPSAPDSAPDTAAFAAQFANPAIWWNNVQEQFSQAVNTAMKPEKTAEKKAGNKAEKKPARKTTATPRKKAPAMRKTSGPKS